MYVISYDVSEDRVRNKIAKELCNYGRRVQYSVFECHITKQKKDELYEKLVRLMQGEADGNIRVYSICARCEEQLMTIGIKNSGMTLEEEELFVI